MKFNLVTVLGPTAVGKTSIAVNLADEFNGEIISADSRQVYRGMDIGTGKDLEEYVFKGKKINYHMIDICSPEEEFNLYNFRTNFKICFEKILTEHKLPFLAGGTGLYLSSVLQNYKLNRADFNSERYTELDQMSTDKLKDLLISLKPGLHNTTDLIDKDRIIKAILVEEAPDSNIDDLDIKSITIGISDDRERIKQNITARLKKRLENGMIEEVKGLIENGLSFEKLMFFGLEYKFIALYLRGELNYNDMFQKLNSAIHKFAKRQMTWFRKMEREGVEINWFNNSEIEKVKDLIREKMQIA